MADSVRTAAQLFDDGTVVVEHATIKREGRDEDTEMKDVEELDAVEKSASSSRSTSVSPKVESVSQSPAGDSTRPSRTPPTGSKAKIKAEKPGPQLIGHLPRAEDTAMASFTEILENHYQYGTLGRSREAGESMTCDCQYEHGVDDPSDACGHDSDCINRLTQVECLSDDCRCRSHCQNQRFQRKQYAPIEVVKTEKKGFGLRAGADLRKDTFIYEYVGDVVSQPSFLKRMRKYAEEGIRHFYFMMLQKDEFIDATKRGGKGRFANHSCNPNCYVAKWSVGKHVRMGIFASRNIKKDEELTFNYNVDRYGHEAQPCYCGEAKCVGFIGGKTQTDLAAMDDLYLDALGITDEVELLGLKGNKKKKGRKLDEDYSPDLKPLLLNDVPKMVQAIRQNTNRKVLVKLLTRIKLTEDQAALRQIMRLRGFSLMTNILEDYAKDADILILALECMMTWPLIQRNKVEDSKVSVPVQACSENENTVIADLAKKLLEQWSALEYAYRIPKKRVRIEEDEDEKSDDASSKQYDDEPSPKRPRESASPEPVSFHPAPLPQKPRSRPPPNNYRQTESQLEKLERQRFDEQRRLQREENARKVAEILKAAARAAEAAVSAPSPPRTTSSSTKKSSKPKMSKEEKEALKEKRLLKLVGAVVVKCMSKYQKQMDHDLFKKHAKELTQTIADKEKKSSSYKENRLETLSDEKVAKIKKFAKEYITKLLRKLEKRQKSNSSVASSSHPESSSMSGIHDEDTLADADGWADRDTGAPGPWTPDDKDSSPQSSSIPDPPADPRMRFRREESGWDPSPHMPATVVSMSEVSVGRLSR